MHIHAQHANHHISELTCKPRTQVQEMLNAFKTVLSQKPELGYLLAAWAVHQILAARRSATIIVPVSTSIAIVARAMMQHESRPTNHSRHSLQACPAAGQDQDC